MEEKQLVKPHHLSLLERKSIHMTGIIDVQSFDTEEIILETSKGVLTIKGNELHVSRLSLEKSEMDIEGNFNSIVYTEGKTSGRKKGESFLSHLFS